MAENVQRHHGQAVEQAHERHSLVLAELGQVISVLPRNPCDKSGFSHCIFS